MYLRLRMDVLDDSWLGTAKMNADLDSMLARAKAILGEQSPMERIASLRLHPSRIEDVRRTYGTGDATHPLAILAGIELVADSLCPKDRGLAVDRQRKLIGVVICESTDPNEWTILTSEAMG